MPATGTDAWVRRFRPADAARATLVCFPHAGGSASFYAPVARALGPTVDVLALQYPGRQDRRFEPTIDSITELAEQLAVVLSSVTGRSFAFFGHSMGATVAFEVARLLEREAARSPVMFWASARRAPSISDAGRVHQLDDDGILAELRRLNGTESALLAEEELLRAFLPAIRGDYKAIETYQCPPGVQLRCPITAFVGDADPIASVDQVSAWRRHTTADFGLRVFPGGHFYLAEHPTEVIDAIRPLLTDAG